MADPQVRLVIGQLRGASERTVKRLVLEATAELIEATPVDTGWARANWVPAIGSPNMESRSGTPDPSQVPGQRGQQQTGLASVAAGYTLHQGPVFISNNVPYVPRLNDGSSDQAPSGFVQRSIQRAVTTVSRGPL